MIDRSTVVRPTEMSTAPVAHPPAPTTLAEAGLSADLVIQLLTKVLWTAGEMTGGDLAKRLGLLYSVIEPCVDAIKEQHHCEVVGAALIGGASYRYRITAEGRRMAAL